MRHYVDGVQNDYDVCPCNKRKPIYKTTCTPGSTGVAGTPAVVIRDDGPDWQSSAKSARYLSRDGRFSFAVGGDVAAGLTPSLSTKGVALGELRYGVAVLDDDIKLVRFGTVLSSIGTASNYDTLEVQALNGVATVSGVSGGAKTTLDTSNVLVGDTFFAAGLINTGDSIIDDPELLQLTAYQDSVSGRYELLGTVLGSIKTTAPVSGGFGFTGYALGAVNGVRAATVRGNLGLVSDVGPRTLRGFAGSGGVSASAELGLTGVVTPNVFAGTVLRIAPMEFFAGNLTGGYADVSVTPLTMDAGSDGGAPVAKYGAGDMSLSAIALGASGIAGEVGGAVDATYSAMYAVGSNFDYTYGTPAINKMTMSAGGGRQNNTLAPMLDFVAVNDFFNSLAAILVEFDSSLDVSGDVSVVIALNAVMDSALNLSDDMTLTQILGAVINDRLAINDRQVSAGEQYKQYVYNVLTGAASRFDGFGFDGFVRNAGSTYAYDRQGVYKVTSENAAPINAMLDLGRSTFGVSQIKHVETAYIGLSTDGTVYLSLDADGKEKTYRVVQREPTMRAHTGRGVVGREWGAKLEILDATRVDLHDVEFVVAASGRRWTR